MKSVQPLLATGLTLAIALGAFFVGRSSGEDDAGARAALALRETREEFRRVGGQLDSRAQDMEARLAESVREIRRDAATSRESSAAALEERWTAERKAWRDATSVLRREIDALGAGVAAALRGPETSDDRFHRIEEAAESSVVLIWCEFAYRTRDDDGHWTEHTESGWGTGFAVSEDGLIVTSKHVVQPWKFDARLAALEAQGLAEILPGRLRLAAWPGGATCLDSERHPLTAAGFDNWDRRNLELVMTAPDRMGENRFEIAGGIVTYLLHEPSNEDLAILAAKGGRFRPLPCWKPGATPPLRKLDRVMTVGFPRGERGLEAAAAISSPAIGTVRKIEDTIHVAMSMIPGNSGGPVFDESGQVVGIATRIYSEGLGICIKIGHALSLLDGLRKNQELAAGNGKTDSRDPVQRATAIADAPDSTAVPAAAESRPASGAPGASAVGAVPGALP